MNFFGHKFRMFKSVERICMACGYVLPRTKTVEESKAWMIAHEGDEVWCGRAWGIYKRKDVGSHEAVQTET